LVHIDANEKICFGMIGTKRFCRSERCRTKAHKGKSSKFVMSTQGGWFIPGKPNLEGSPNAFLAPFLDDSKITEDTSYDLVKAFTSRTTPEWERFILESQEEWEELQARKLANIQESGDSDAQDDDDEDDGTLWEGKLKLTSLPSEFEWAEDLVTTGVASTLLDKGTTKDMDEAIKNLQAAFEDIDEVVADTRSGARNDAREILSHIDFSVTDIVLAIDRINQRGRTGWDLIGDIKAMREDREEPGLTLVGAVSRLLDRKDDLDEDPPQVLEELSDLIASVDSDLITNCRLLNDKIKLLERKISDDARPPRASLCLTLSTPLLDERGDCVTTLGGILQENSMLRQENSKLVARIDRLTADVSARGGVTLGRHVFSSELQLSELVMKECPSGDAFSAFVDPMVIFCFDANYQPLKTWESLTKAMEKSGAHPITDRKVVASYNAQYCWWFSEFDSTVAGQTISAFSSKDKWQGVGGMHGRRKQIELSLESASDGVRTALDDKLPDGGELRQLGLRMLEHTVNWFSTVFKHLDSEYTRLTQVNLSEKDALILMSEEIIIMFDRFYSIRRKRMEFSLSGSKVDYMVRCIWISLQVHMAMDEFTQHGMEYNSALGAAFTRFLTKVTGSNAAAGVSGSISSLETKLKGLESSLKEVKKEAAAATTRATSANNAAEEAKGKLAKLFQNNTTLKK
jgi:hypothetical protein